MLNHGNGLAASLLIGSETMRRVMEIQEASQVVLVFTGCTVEQASEHVHWHLNQARTSRMTQKQALDNARHEVFAGRPLRTTGVLSDVRQNENDSQEEA